MLQGKLSKLFALSLIIDTPCPQHQATFLAERLIVLTSLFSQTHSFACDQMDLINSMLVFLILLVNKYTTKSPFMFLFL